MYYESYTDIKDQTYNIKLQLTREDLEKLQLDDIDKLVVKSCTNTKSIADKLIALEIVFRNIEHQLK